MSTPDPQYPTTPYGQPSYPASPYGAPGPQPGQAFPGASQYHPAVNPFGAQGMMREHPNATLVLVLGVLGFVVGGITGPLAWYFGSKARAEIAANPGRYTDNSSLTIGWVCGIISTLILVGSILLVVLFFAGGLALMAAGR